ncbi:MAG: hypothetical protein AAF366_07625 [Pseudomonadota bacterium]
MAHLPVALTALGALSAVLAIVFVLQADRPGLRWLGATMLLALTAAMAIGLFTA